MSRKIAKSLTKIVLVMGLVSSLTVASLAASGDSQKPLTEQVRHQLVMLPYYGVFDNLAYKVDGSTVTLYGQVVRPTTKDDAERSVLRIPGVDHVVNDIEVLPLSPMDDQTRVALYRRIFSTGGLYRYSMGANPSIHIIVDNGHVTLEGIVANEMDKNLAGIAANGVFGVFSVQNNLRVEKKRS
ncbi:MAG TPA: BON domain-containing protein [Blastocatellia bacterium]|nr:BON domain-containing protein [Blastocatellia bacterium]